MLMENQQLPQEPVQVQGKVSVLLVQPNVPTPNISQKKSKKKLIITLALIGLILLAGAAVWFFVLKDKKATSSDTATQTSADSASSKEEVKKPLVPYTIPYAFGDFTKENVKLYWRPAAGGDRVEAQDLGAKAYVSHSGVNGTNVFAVTDPTFGSSQGTTVWISVDAGKTYTKALVGKPLPADGAWDQVTSAVFSNDGSSLLIAFLPSTGNNTVKEIDVASKKVTDLFTSEQRGVFLSRYDKNAKKVYYSEGCYNCDGNSFNTVLVRSLASSKVETLYADATSIVVSSALNHDFTKILIASGTQSTEGLGASKPYKIEEYDIAAKTTKRILDIGEEVLVSVGYRDDGSSGGAGYYLKGGTIKNLGSAEVEMFTTTKKINSLLYIGRENVFVTTGEYNNYELINYNLVSKATTKILAGDDKTRLFGVTLQ